MPGTVRHANGIRRHRWPARRTVRRRAIPGPRATAPGPDHGGIRRGSIRVQARTGAFPPAVTAGSGAAALPGTGRRMIPRFAPIPSGRRGVRDTGPPARRRCGSRESGHGPPVPGSHESSAGTRRRSSLRRLSPPRTCGGGWPNRGLTVPTWRRRPVQGVPPRPGPARAEHFRRSRGRIPFPADWKSFGTTCPP